MIASAIANDGVMMEPKLLISATAPNGTQRAKLTSKVYRKPLTSDQAAILKDYMRAVVTGGTGTSAKISGTKVCGKTGSAELDGQEIARGTAEYNAAEQAKLSRRRARRYAMA